MEESDFIEKINQSLRGPASAPIIGGIPDKVLPDLIKKNEFEHPPLINELHTKRFAFPLTLSHADRLASHRMALIGDAAHRVHPLAGQGLNLGMSDVAFLGNNILTAKREGQDIGNYDAVLSQYDRQAKANSYALVSAIEFVKNSYRPDMMGSENLGHALALARNAGIDMIELSDFAKFNFMNFASGNITHPSKYEWTK